MQALRLNAIHHFELAEVPEPRQVGANDILVKIKAVGICGTDLHYYHGIPTSDRPVEYPLIMGHEFAGEIEAVGSQVGHLKVGDRVAMDPVIACGYCEPCTKGYPNVCLNGEFVGAPGKAGALQEKLVHPARCAFKLPEYISYAEGAALEALGVAYHAVQLAKVKLADTIAVLGCGPIGLMIIQLARLNGAKNIFATEVIPHRLKKALDMGADFAFNPLQIDPVEGILTHTQKRGVDIAFEVAGAAETPTQAIEVTKACGTTVMIGIGANEHLSFRATPARKKALTIRICRRMGHVYPRIISLVEHGFINIKSLITHNFSRAKGAKAFALLDGYKDNVGKVIIV